MDTSVAITTTVIVVLGATPFVLSYVHNRNREKKMLTMITDEATDMSCKVDDYEICGDYAIGIDREKGMLFFGKESAKIEIRQSFLLSEYIDCKAITVGRSVDDGGKRNKFTDRLCLTLIPRQKTNAVVELEFFNASLNGQLSGELESVEKWAGIARSIIRKKA